jgi:hypothetical protein
MFPARTSSDVEMNCTHLRHNGSLAHPFPRRFAAHLRVGVVGQSRNLRHRSGIECGEQRR